MADLRKLKDKAAELAAKGKLEKAADLFRQALAGDPKDVATRQKLADVLRRCWRVDDAIEQYRDVAHRYGQDGLLIKAIAISKTILELDPEHVDTQATLADLYARKAKAEGTRPPTRRTLLMTAVRAPEGSPPPRRDTEDRVVAIPLPPAAPPDPFANPIPLDAGPSPAPPDAGDAGWAGALPFDPGAVSLDAGPPAAAAVPVRAAGDARVAAAPPATPLDTIVAAAAEAGVEEELILEPEPFDDPSAPSGDEPLDPYVPPVGAAPPASQVAAPPQAASRAPAPGAATPAGPPVASVARPPRAAPAPAPAGRPGAPAAAAGGLPRVPIFSDLSREAFVALTTAMSLRRVAPGEAVIREGDGGASFYVVATGALAVSKRNDRGDEVALARLGEGDFFGEMALLSGAPRSATVAAEVPSEVLEFRADVLVDVARKHPHLAESLRRFYRQRLLANAMAVSPIFRPFGKGDRKLIMERFRARDVHAGDVVVREGEPSDGLYVVLEGAVDVVKWGEAGRNVVVGRLREGDLFGEMSCLRKAPATASVVVTRAGTLLRLPRRDFDELVMTYPQVLQLVSELSEERSESLDAILSGRAEWTEEGLVLV